MPFRLLVARKYMKRQRLSARKNEISKTVKKYETKIEKNIPIMNKRTSLSMFLSFVYTLKVSYQHIF